MARQKFTKLAIKFNVDHTDTIGFQIARALADI